MRTDVPLDWYSKLAHLDVTKLGGRVVPGHALWNGKSWSMWIPGPHHLIQMSAEPVEAYYYATAPEHADDARFRFLEFFQQRIFWPDIVPFVEGLYSDVLNAGATISKLRLIFDHADRNSHDSARMVASEIEYVFLNCRSMFDLLQQIMLKLWKKVELRDPSLQKRNLPDSYRRMVMQDEQPMSSGQIAERWALPDAIAETYATSAQFFVWLRAYRDLIAHKGRTPDLIYHTERGFAIQKTSKPFADMTIWDDSNSLPNDLGSLLSVVAHVLLSTFTACDAWADTIAKTIQMPSAIAPAHQIYIRAPHMKNLNRLNSFIHGDPWFK
jgi:hypothetical protein